MVVRLARFLLVVALLAGWQSALVHPIEHVDQHGKLVHLGDGPQPGNATCDLLSALTACAPQGKLPVAAMTPHVPPSVQPVGVPLPAEAPPFLSQGPPAAA